MSDSNVINNDERVLVITERLQAALSPTSLTVDDESHLHAGHAGAKSGKGHFAVHIVSEAFTGQRPLARHRAVYDALGDYTTTDIHALSISAKTPAETS